MTVYTFEDTNGIEQTFTTLDPNEADRYAAQYDFMAVANEYEWSDSEIFKDYRPENPNDIEEN